jgi:putative transposase
MPRNPRIFTSLFPYHVTARSNNKDWFYLPIDLIWSIMARHLQTAQQDYPLLDFKKLLGRVESPNNYGCG